MSWLADIRRQRGLSQQAVAQLAHVTQPTYCNIENGRRNPSVETARNIAQVLSFSWTKFFEEGGNA